MVQTFNPTAVGDLSEISTVANDDVFLAVDTSGGGLKKITRSAVVAGLATSSAISNVSEGQHSTTRWQLRFKW